MKVAEWQSRIDALLEAGLSRGEAEEVVDAQEANKRTRAATALEHARGGAATTSQRAPAAHDVVVASVAIRGVFGIEESESATRRRVRGLLKRAREGSLLTFTIVRRKNPDTETITPIPADTWSDTAPRLGHLPPGASNTEWFCALGERRSVSLQELVAGPSVGLGFSLANLREHAPAADDMLRAAKPIASTLPNLPQGGPASKTLKLALAVCDTSRSHTQLANDLAALFPDRCRVDGNGRLWLDGTDRHGVLVRALTAARKR